jgi:acyl-homoserine-lactone acylase
MSRRRRLALALCLGALLAGVLADAAAADPSGVTIRRTSHGIPHIIAGDWESLGYGYGYSLAEDNICTLAETYVTVQAQRSRYFGPDDSYVFQGNGQVVNNLNSDFFFQRIIDNHTVEDLLGQPPPTGPVQQIRDLVQGYVEGYNQYLADTGVDNIPDPSCRGAAWVRPITVMDAYRRFYQLALLASSGVVIDGIAAAAPPTPPLPGQTATQPPRPEDVAEGLGRAGLPLGGIGSNAVGLGAAATANGSGMMLANPHFPWQGSERFYQAQLTIPGQLNVSGASLLGVPLILIGATDNLAWSHTVSTAYRFTPFEETLVPGSPTTYIYDGQPKEMKAEQVTVQVPAPGGGLQPETRTLYSTQHGPIFDSLVGVPLPWTATSAFAMGDANATNFRYLNHFFETDQAQSVGELYEILRRNQGIPWVNTLASDSSGRAFYADISVTPHVTDEQALQCNTAVGAATFAALGLPVLDGSRSDCEWGSDPDSVQPGTFGPSHMPHLFRSDYVENSNDSYWLSNPRHPLEGFDRIIGDERTPRALRTRSGLTMIRARLHGKDHDPGETFTLRLLQKMVFSDRQYAGRLFRGQLVDYCRSHPTLVTRSGKTVDVSGACEVLHRWDLRDNLDSNGALLFRRFASHLLSSPVPTQPAPAIYKQDFDPSHPVDTPRGLNTDNPVVGNSLAEAVDDLDSCAIPLDAPLRGYQYESRGTDQIPIHGGPGTLGVFNAINVTWHGCDAYNDVSHGSSFVMATSFTPGAACPVNARSILTYSQSAENPESPYFADQTWMFSDKRWVDLPICENEIAADPGLQVTELNGGYSP